MAACRARYHYLNGKMVEVKRANENKTRGGSGGGSPPLKGEENGWNAYSLF